MVFLTGATGFVGGHLARALLARGHRLRCLVRPGAGARKLQELRSLGAELATGDIAEPESLAQAMRGTDSVIHLVGIIYERRKATFEQIHHRGTRNVVDAARRAGIGRYLQMSALGTAPSAESKYHQTKWKAEEYVRAHAPDWTIFRPSVIFGPGDGFVNQLADLIRKAPVVPVVGSGEYLLQPVSIQDVVECFAQSLEKPETMGKTYEIGGPEQLTFNRILEIIMAQLGVKKRRIHLPAALMYPPALFFEKVVAHFTMPPLTTQQLKMLKGGNTCDMRETLAAFSLPMVRLEYGIRTYIKPAPARAQA